MKTNIWVISVAAGVVLAGCSGPLKQGWDDPVYRSIQDRFAQHDRRVIEIADDEQSQVLMSVDLIKALSHVDAIRFAVHNSPRLRAAGYRVDAASGRIIQAGLYPNPSFEFGGEAIGSGAGGAGETAYVFQQEIVLGGKLDRIKDVAHTDELGARAVFIALEFAVASEVSRAYFSSLAAQERLKKQEELSAFAIELYESTEERVRAGRATKSDGLRAQIAYEQAQLDLDSAGFGVVHTGRSLALAIGVAGEVSWPLSSSLDQFPLMDSYEELVASMLELNSRISMANLEVVRARQLHQLAKANAVPNLVASIGPRYSDTDDETTVDIGLGVEIPLFDWNQGEIQATLAERLSASTELRNVQLELIDELSQAWSVYESARSNAQRYQDHLLPMAERTLELTREVYQSGKVDYLRLLDAQQVMIESQMAYIDTLEQLHLAAATINELSQSHSPWRSSRNINQLNTEVESE